MAQFFGMKSSGCIRREGDCETPVDGPSCTLYPHASSVTLSRTASSIPGPHPLTHRFCYRAEFYCQIVESASLSLTPMATVPMPPILSILLILSKKPAAPESAHMPGPPCTVRLGASLIRWGTTGLQAAFGRNMHFAQCRVRANYNKNLPGKSFCRKMPPSASL